ncbi:unnamed protein product [Arctogadus glacialis]
MESVKNSGEQEAGPGERGLAHLWRGYACSLAPERLLLSRPVVQASLGTRHGLLLVEGGQVYSFGVSPWKQPPSPGPRPPALEPSLSGRRVVSVATGSSHCGAVTEDGGVHMWGANGAGQCGLAGPASIPNPTPVALLLPAGPAHSAPVLELALGHAHSLALSAQREVWAWGRGPQLGLLGSAPSSGGSAPSSGGSASSSGGSASSSGGSASPSGGPAPSWRPRRVEHLAGRHVLQVGCGSAHSLALVRCQGPRGGGRGPGAPLDACGRCHQLLYTMTDREDHVIISDSHYCPLGVELTEEGEEPRTRGASPTRSRRTSPSKPRLPEGRAAETPLGVAAPVGGGVAPPPVVAPPPAGADPAPGVGDGAASPYPHEDAVREYLRRLSDHALIEPLGHTHMEPSDHALIEPLGHAHMELSGDAQLEPLSHAHMEKPDHAQTQQTATAELSSEPAPPGPGSPLPAPPPGPAHHPGSALNSLVTLCASAVGERVASTYEALSLKKMMHYYLSSSGGPADCGAPGCGGGAALEESMQARKSSSTGDIRAEEAEGRRRLSLPGLLSQVSPRLLRKLGRPRGPAVALTQLGGCIPGSQELLPPLQTEVWSWGHGGRGQLGHGDHLARLQPLCIKSLNNKEVVRVAAGDHHSLALTAGSQVFSWGSNSSGQLGHMESPTTVPRLAKFSEGIRVWDVAAGGSHSVFVADGDCVQPILYYSGRQGEEEGEEKAGVYTQQPVLLPFCMNLGYTSSVCAGGGRCLSLSDRNVMGFIAGLHEVASVERRFYCRLTAIKTGALRPLLEAGEYYTNTPVKGPLLEAGEYYTNTPVKGPLLEAGEYYTNTPVKGPLLEAGGYYTNTPVKGPLLEAGEYYTNTPVKGPLLEAGGYYTNTPVKGPLLEAGEYYTNTPVKGPLLEAGGYYTNTPVKGPLLEAESLSPTLGAVLLGLLQTLVGGFSLLYTLTGQHSASLTSALRRGRDLQALLLLNHAHIFLDAYRQYCTYLGNFHVMGGFQALSKPALEVFGKTLDPLLRLSESPDEGPASDHLMALFTLPLGHLGEYGRLLLKLATCYEVSSSEYQRLHSACSQFEALTLHLKKRRKEAEYTHHFWKSFPGKMTDSLRRPGRRLVCESSNKALSLLNASRFSVNWFILFSDALVHAQFSTHHVFPLATLWVEPISEENSEQYGLKVISPEETFTLLACSPIEKAKWLRAINQTVDLALGGAGPDPVTLSPGAGQKAEPPISRTASYTFRKDARLREATYEGRWLAGRPHGRGVLKWPDGRIYTGSFKMGLEDGYGEFVSPTKTAGVQEQYLGHWKEGRMHGAGTYRYSSGEVYEGSFRDGVRHGHGMLRSGRLTSSSSSPPPPGGRPSPSSSSSSPPPSVFIGRWIADRKAGYGVYDDITRGEKYIGVYQENQRQGSGVIVTQFGLYYEGTFKDNKMGGTGVLVAEDDTTYEGEFSEDWTLYGKGVLTMPNGDYLEGSFSGEWGSGLKISGTYHKPFDPERRRPPPLGRLCVCAEDKWPSVFEECWAALGCTAPGQGPPSRAWEGIAVALTASRRHLQDSPEVMTHSMSRTLESLEVIPQHSGPITMERYTKIRLYLIKACDSPLHPLGRLLEVLVAVYRMTYVGVGANRRLLPQAVSEIKSYLERLFTIVRFLFPDLPEEGGVIPETPSSPLPQEKTSSPGSGPPAPHSPRPV